MRRINYNSSRVLEEAWKEIDQQSPVEVEITGSIARKIARSFPHYLRHLDTKLGRTQRQLSLLKWAMLGAFAAPTLWAICNRARLKGMVIDGVMMNESFIVKVG